MAKRINKREKNLGKTKTYGKVNLKKEKIEEEKSSNLWIAWFVICVFILALCALKMGFLVTLCAAIMLLIISGLAYLVKSTKKDTKKRKILNIFLIIFLTLFILIMILFGAFLIYITINAPKFNVDNLNTKEISIIYDKDGKEITRLGDEKREKVSYSDLPEVLVDALVSTEDSRFFEHNGFDAPRFAKATIGQLMGRSSAGGASTLSMQVIKNAFTSSESTGIKGIIRKFTDIYLAVFKLEKKYTKEEIIEFYVNNHPLGGMIYGVEEASKAYFNKDVSDLNLSEAAIIAGMFKAPNSYRPTAYPENAAARRKTVLYLMERHGYITKDEEIEANSIPVESLTKDASGGTSREGGKYQDYIDTVIEEMQDKYEINPKTTSVKIYTNLDTSKQDIVNDVESGKTYTWKDDKIQTGITILDSGSGKVLAVGAGRNRNAGDTIRATSAFRQIGSTAKPIFDYGPGFEYGKWSTFGYQDGDNSYKLFEDTPYSYSDGTSISDWDNGYYGAITLRKALSTSRNIPALKAFQKNDNNKIKEFVTGLGITPEICGKNNTGYTYDRDKDLCVSKENEKETKKPTKIFEAHSIGAFSPGATPMQMAAAYAAFSNGGTYYEPYTVDHFTYRQTGETVKHKEVKRKMMSEATAYMISSVLQDVQLTGGSIKNVAAKTGTTNFDDATVKARGLPADAIRDSWVVGYTTKTVISMWYGYDSNENSQYVLRNIPATIAKDKEFKALANAFEQNKEDFKMPDTVERINIISGTNPARQAPDGYTGPVVSELFLKDNLPNSASSNVEDDVKLPNPTNLSGTYSSGKVVLTWTGVTAPSNNGYGKIVYNVYRGNTLLKVVDGTTYTDTNPGNGTVKYKVVATYESYNALASDGAEISVKAEEETKQITYKVIYKCNGTDLYSSPRTKTGTVKGNGKYTVNISDLLVGISDQSNVCDVSSSTATADKYEVSDGDTVTITLPKKNNGSSGTGTDSNQTP